MTPIWGWLRWLGPILCRSCSEFRSTTSMSFPEDVFFHHTFPSSGFYILHPLPFWNVLWPLRMGSTLHHHLVLTLWAATGFSLHGHSPQQCEASLVKAGCLSQSLINRQWEQVLNMLLFFFQIHSSKIYATLFLRVDSVTLNPNFSNTWLALAYSVGLASHLPVLHIFLSVSYTSSYSVFCLFVLFPFLFLGLKVSLFIPPMLSQYERGNS